MEYTPLQQGATPIIGTSGDAIKALQTQLNTQNAGKVGYVPLKVDGLYGPLTQAASQYKSPQSGIVQDTSAINTKDALTGSKLDEKVAALTQTVPAYGSDVKDAQGNVIGQAKFDPNTGQPLDPNTSSTSNKNAPQPGTITTPDGGTYSTAIPEGYSYQLPPAPEGSKYIYGADGHPYLQDAKGNVTTDPTAEAEYTKNKTAKKEIDDRNKLYDDYKVGLDATHQTLIDSIKKQAADQTIKMGDLNKRMLALKTVQGYRTGSAEYTPEIDTGILKAEEEEGMARIAEIDANMKIAIAQAVAAKNEKDFELLDKRMTTINNLQKAKEESVQNIYKAYVDNAKLIADKMKEAETLERAQRDQALQELPTKSLQMEKDYNALKTAAQKEAYIASFIKATGLSREDLLGQFEKNKIEAKNKAKETKPTDAEKKTTVISEYSSGFQPNQTFTNSKGDKVAIVDPNGYANPEAFKNAISQAPAKGISRTDFLKNFGYLVYLPSASTYGLTPVEIKLLTGKAPEVDEDGLN